MPDNADIVSILAHGSILDKKISLPNNVWVIRQCSQDVVKSKKITKHYTDESGEQKIYIYLGDKNTLFRKFADTLKNKKISTLRRFKKLIRYPAIGNSNQVFSKYWCVYCPNTQIYDMKIQQDTDDHGYSFKKYYSFKEHELKEDIKYFPIEESGITNLSNIINNDNINYGDTTPRVYFLFSCTPVFVQKSKDVFIPPPEFKPRLGEYIRKHKCTVELTELQKEAYNLGIKKGTVLILPNGYGTENTESIYTPTDLSGTLNLYEVVDITTGIIVFNNDTRQNINIDFFKKPELFKTYKDEYGTAYIHQILPDDITINIINQENDKNLFKRFLYNYKNYATYEEYNKILKKLLDLYDIKELEIFLQEKINHSIIKFNGKYCESLLEKIFTYDYLLNKIGIYLSHHNIEEGDTEETKDEDAIDGAAGAAGASEMKDDRDDVAAGGAGAAGAAGAAGTAGDGASDSKGVEDTADGSKYYEKYIKYKNKYLSLQNIPSEFPKINSSSNYQNKYTKYKNKYLMLKHKL